VIHRVYRCPPGTAVEFYIVLGGGHAWPGSEFSEKIAAITGPTTFEIDASEIIWAFFQRFQL
jgi:polyhydroxybutyrate depolymerase